MPPPGAQTTGQGSTTPVLLPSPSRSHPGPGTRLTEYQTVQGAGPVKASDRGSSRLMLSPSRDRDTSPAKLADMQKQNEALQYKLQVMFLITLVLLQCRGNTVAAIAHARTDPGSVG